MDNEIFEGIRKFQKDNGLKVDGLMNPGGPTEKTINWHLAAANETSAGPRYKMPVIIPPNVDPNMPEIKEIFWPRHAPYIDENGNIVLEGEHPKTGFPISPPKRL